MDFSDEIQENTYPIPVVAITGGIGSGKSTAATVFQRNGSLVVDADRIAKELLWSDKKLQKAVIQEFGTGICDETGIIDKKLLTNAVFQNQTTIERLNKIIHPAVIQHIRDIVKQNVYSQTYTMIVVDAALIFEACVEKDFDFIVIVVADNKKRIERTSVRDRSAESEIFRRINVQQSQQEHIEKSDFVLYNDGTAEELQYKARELFAVILKTFNSKKK